jgi:predicted DNA-binding transcriptional regulator AlpA
MSSTRPKTRPADPDADLDVLVSDPQVQLEFGGITAMTLHRWTNDDKLGFPAKIKIGDRNFRSRHAIEEFKAALIKPALANRKTLTAA